MSGIVIGYNVDIIKNEWHTLKYHWLSKKLHINLIHYYLFYIVNKQTKNKNSRHVKTIKRQEVRFFSILFLRQDKVTIIQKNVVGNVLGGVTLKCFKISFFYALSKY